MTTTRPNITAAALFIALFTVATPAAATAPVTSPLITVIVEDDAGCSPEELRELRKQFPGMEITCIQDVTVLELITPLPRREAEVTETRQPRFGATASTTSKMHGTAIFTARFRVKVVRPATKPALETACGHAINLSGTDGDIGAQIALGMSTKCLLEARLPADVGTLATQVATATK